MYFFKANIFQGIPFSFTKIQEFIFLINLKKELYYSLTTLLDNEEKDDNDFNELININYIQQEEQLREKIDNFIYLLASIADNILKTTKLFFFFF